MEDALVIESKPLDAKQATALLSVLAQTQVPGAAAADLLAIRLSLERIVVGKDIVSQANTVID